MPSLFKSISNWFRGKKDQAAEALANPIRDGKFAIEDSEKRVRQFQSKVAKFIAVNKQLEREIDTQQREVDKWMTIARKAAAAGNEADVTQAIEAKQRAEQVMQEKQKQYQRNEQIVDQLRKQVQTAIAKVAKAKANYSQLVARHEGAQVRKELADAASDFGSEGPLAELDDLQKAVDQEETEAEALEEMATVSSGPTSLEEKYNTASSSSVQDEVSLLMAQAKK
ncbi:MAG: PspA/IM30 family protein [Gemmataceae bacterium]